MIKFGLGQKVPSAGLLKILKALGPRCSGRRRVRPTKIKQSISF